MKTVSRFASSILAAGLLAGSPVAVFAADPPPTQPAPESKLVTAAPADARVRQAISAIEQAPDPSAVVEAYAAAAENGSIPLKQAFVKRLVTLGIPELAEAQASDLAQRQPDDGLAWAVVAFMAGRRNNTPAALNDVVIAARQAPDDPFVERTAAQIIAYYEAHSDQFKVDAPLHDSTAAVRQSLGDKPIFVQTYQQARLAYAQAAARLMPTSAPGAAQAVAPPTEPYSVAPAEPYYSAAPTTVYNNTYTQPATDPFAYDDYAANSWWPSAWGWDPGIVIIDGPFFRDRFEHRFDDRDGRSDGRFDHGFDDGRGRGFDRGERSSDGFRSDGSPDMTRDTPTVHSAPSSPFGRPSTPIRSSPGFSGGAGAGRSTFGSPMRGGASGHMGGGFGHGGGGSGGHR
jgi:hypothetical protein